MFRRLLTLGVAALLSVASGVRAAELTAEDLTLGPGAVGTLVVSGDIAGEWTFGVTIQVELVPQGGAVGTLTFTLAPPVDVVQLGDPWPGLGAFSPFDTDLTGFDTLNGSVDDNGNFEPGPVSFLGPLTGFPVIASADAVGVWDVLLSTTAGVSGWEGIPTTLFSGIVTVIPGECFTDPDCDDGIGCTDDTCVSATCVFTPNDASCPDDGLFCNGTEVCDAVSDCVSTGDPCQGAEFCNEVTDQCDECQVDPDCDDWIGCTDDTCASGSCTYTPNDTNCPDDGLYCNGTEICDPVLDCASTGDPCQASGQICDEATDMCLSCTADPDCDDGNVCTDDFCNVDVCEYTNNTLSCDDGQFCTATDVCSGGLCVGSGDPCPSQLCDEASDTCTGSVASLTVESLEMPTGATADLAVSGLISGFDTFGVTLFVELVPRSGNTGSVLFTPAPPTDIFQIDDIWPGVGTFTPFDTDLTGFDTLNGCLDDNGNFQPGPVVFTGQIAGFPLSASVDAGGVWDVYLSTSAGDSSWEGVPTSLAAGTVSVSPPVGLTVNSLAMPPGAIVDLVVSGTVENQSTFGVTIMAEIVPRAGTTGTVTFTVAPPVDVYQIGDPWSGVGQFTPFDTDLTGSSLLNGSVDDNGTYISAPLMFSGALTGLPVGASVDADGVWDVTLMTSLGASYWQELSTVLVDGTITVTPGACATNADCDDGDPCTDDACNVGTCEYFLNTAPCDDASACTENDVCTDGVCGGTPLPEGAACDNGDPCNVGETCVAGLCQGLGPPDCSAFGDDCNEATCDPGGAEGNCDIVTPVPDGTACDDGDMCSVGETCQSGICTVGAPPDCSGVGGDCTTASCDPNGMEGNCDILTPVNEGGPCAGDPCIAGEICSTGFCGDGLPVDCSAVGDQCNTASCDPAGAEGNCSILTPVLDGTPCDDGAACNVGETCQSGVCSSGGLPDCSGAGDDCNTASCDPGGLEGNCDTMTPANEGGPCGGSDPCLSSGTCAGGVCSGPPVDCSFLDDVCVVGACNPANGVCITNPANEGGVCDDGIPCTVGDVCVNGTCTGTPTGAMTVSLSWWPPSQTVMIGDPVFIALTMTSQTCIDLPIASVDAILNWNPLVLVLAGNTDSDSSPFVWTNSGFEDDCMLDGLNFPCTGDPILPDNDGDALYHAFADFTVGVDATTTGTIVTIMEFTSVGTSPATLVDIPASAGSYTFTRILGAGDYAAVDLTGPLSSATVTVVECLVSADCSDGNLCTTDSCVAGACQNVNNSLPCNDGLFCTAIDTCTGGACVGSGDPCPGLLCDEDGNGCVQCFTAADCDDANVCTDETCISGICIWTPNSEPCDDGLFCTDTDVCSGNVCVGGGDPCPGQLCNEGTNECVECLTNADCDDVNLCTDDTCVAGACENIDNTNPCDDGLFCTTTDVCSLGACVGSGDPCPGLLCDEDNDACVQCFTGPDCDDANACTDDTCIAGLCIWTNNTDPCDDGLFCTASDVCTGGSCIGSGDECPGLLCDEPNDRCVECFTAGDCEDFVPCTINTCVDGTCVFVPDHASCDDFTFCTGAEVCDLVAGCLSPGDPCAPPLMCDEANDRCVECFNDPDCDDGLLCTTEVCVDGTCFYTPNDPFCDDGLFCTGAEFCDLQDGCTSPGNPCDNPALCDEVSDACGCEEPTVLVEGSRSLAITPASGVTPVALRVDAAPPGLPCLPLYVGADGRLSATPVFQTPADWGTVHATGVYIEPSMQYDIQSDCRFPGDPENLSIVVGVTTYPWGDVTKDGIVDLEDIVAILDAFGGDFGTGSLYDFDLSPCDPDERIDVDDVLDVLDALAKLPYPCSDPCP